MHLKLATVVIPVRNRPELLKICLQSIHQQDYPIEKYEVIVCDDGSTENLATVIEEASGKGLDVRLVRQEPCGPASARNLGVKHATTGIIVFVDSDIEAGPSLVRCLVEPLLNDLRYAGMEGKLVPTGGQENPLWHAPRSLTGGRYHTAAIAYRKDALQTAGGLDEAFKYPLCEDAELAARILRDGVIGFSDEAIAYHPRRSVTVASRWAARKAWYYATIVAMRYGVVSLPFRKTKFPRMRLVLSAVVLVPAGRLRASLPWIIKAPGVGLRASGLACLDFVIGLFVAPGILLMRCPKRRRYLSHKGLPTLVSTIS